ncbi:hypothetical protein KSP40_PGU014997 [Platanthera guangdongensis]|uniref:Uncharacterized protein n=1 Tax=Platanthera guangdongensis TaxID=2320717 RepID=A0ABR2M7X9_9ASPA
MSASSSRSAAVGVQHIGLSGSWKIRALLFHHPHPESTHWSPWSTPHRRSPAPAPCRVGSSPFTPLSDLSSLCAPPVNACYTHFTISCSAGRASSSLPGVAKVYFLKSGASSSLAGVAEETIVLTFWPHLGITVMGKHKDLLLNAGSVISKTTEKLEFLAAPLRSGLVLGLTSGRRKNDANPRLFETGDRVTGDDETIRFARGCWHFNENGGHFCPWPPDPPKGRFRLLQVTPASFSKLSVPSDTCRFRLQTPPTAAASNRGFPLAPVAVAYRRRLSSPAVKASRRRLESKSPDDAMLEQLKSEDEIILRRNALQMRYRKWLLFTDVASASERMMPLAIFTT